MFLSAKGEGAEISEFVRHRNTVAIQLTGYVVPMTVCAMFDVAVTVEVRLLVPVDVWTRTELVWTLEVLTMVLTPLETVVCVIRLPEEVETCVIVVTNVVEEVTSCVERAVVVYGELEVDVRVETTKAADSVLEESGSVEV